MKYYTLAFILSISACTCKNKDKNYEEYLKVQDSLSNVILLLEKDKDVLEMQIDETEVKIENSVPTYKEVSTSQIVSSSNAKVGNTGVGEATMMVNGKAVKICKILDPDCEACQ
jgi:hypothetical protein